MPSTYQHTIEELIARYQLEPTVRDMYVEGSTDVSALTWFFRETNSPEVRVYAIATVSVPTPYPAEMGGGGEKGRVIALALRLATSLTPQCQSVRCLADKDFFGILQQPPDCRFLLTTDYSCIESYSFAPIPLKKFFSLYFETTLGQELLASIYDVLRTLFYLRAAKHDLDPQVDWIEDYTSLMAYNGGSVTFDHLTFASRVSMKAGSFSQAALLDRAEKIRGSADTSPLNTIHKADALRLLCWLGRKLKCPNFRCHTDPVARALVATWESGVLMTSPLFSSLATWATTPTLRTSVPGANY